jgi:hypothetical protein
MFEACEFCTLDAEDRQMLLVFLKSRGNMKELERHLGVSYPTARARFDRLLTTLGLEGAESTPPERLGLLESLARGDIDVGQALEQLD